MKYTIWKIKGRLRVTKFFIKAAAIYIAEDIKDYILKGRERHSTIDNDTSDTNSGNSIKTNSR